MSLLPRRGVIAKTVKQIRFPFTFYDIEDIRCTYTYTYTYTIYNIQYTIYNIQSTIYNLQSTIYNIQYTIYNIQYTIYNIHTYMCIYIYLYDLGVARFCTIV